METDMRATWVFLAGLFLGGAGIFLLASLGVIGKATPPISGHGEEHGKEEHGAEEEDRHEGERGEPRRIELKEGAAKLAGIRVEPAAKRALEKRLVFPAEVQIPPSKIAHVGPRIEGVIHEVKKQIGDKVEAGDVLAILDSVPMGEAKSAFLRAQAELELAEKTLAREKELVETAGQARKSLYEAETGLEKARIELRATREKLYLLGLTDEQIGRIAGEKGEDRAHVTVIATFAGMVIEKHAAPGEFVGPEEKIFTIADLRELWVLVSVPEKDVHRLPVGVGVEIRVGTHEGERLLGVLTYIDPRVDPKTRRVQVRVEAKNESGKLRPSTFAEVSIPVAEAREAVAVRAGAVQRVDGKPVVFVAREEGKAFEVREVQLGIAADGWVAVVFGLDAGEPVAVSGTFLLKSEAEKEKIGEGHSH